jgi:hypothetical protein
MRWNDSALAEIRRVKGNDFEAVDTSSMQINVNSGQARTQSCPNGDDDADNDGIPCTIEVAEGLNPALRDNRLLDNTAQGVRLYVMQQYRDYLKRQGDAAGIAFWASEINAGRQSRGTMAQTFLASGEFANNISPMTRLYFASFSRVPDHAGLSFWTEQYASGARSLENIAAAFASSQEFINRYGNLSNRDFVDRVYMNVLARSTSTDPQGAAYWQAELDTGRRTRGQVMLAFSDGNEFRNTQANAILVISLYSAMLRRAPSQTEFQTDVTSLNAAGSLSTLIQRTLNTSEYAARFF